MPQIIPIKDLKNTSAISAMCNSSNEPIYITKNGYGDMVIMSVKTYEEISALQDIYSKLALAEQNIIDNKAGDAVEKLKALREKFNV